ncbi:ATP-binding cassette sub-family A member 3 [Geodia barretti]|uniref:ATP-binding cassette sub-family A member 3 n=1 Tax=Geodia barretti TaxID=519541 RepID=A0AA35TSF4_GEOBA|nr:ATP-binding cassette sub-family A member 3 [Geodia barretti]
MSGATQFLLVLWKNFLLQVRRPVGTLVELVIPPLAVVVLVGLKFGLFDIENRIFVTFPSDHLTVPLPNNTYQIYYAPNTTNTRKIADCIEKKLPYARVTGVNSDQDIVSALSSVAPPIVLSGSEYDSSECDSLKLPTNTPLGCFIRGAGIYFNNLESDSLEYTLRLRHEVGEDKSWETRDAAPNFQAPGPRITDNFYLSEGFIHLENIVGEAVIRLMANPNMTDCDGGLEHNISVAMRQLPYPQYTVDFFLITAVSILPFLIVLAFIYSAGTFTKELVLEKETRIRESMLMMGLKQWVLWTTWFIKQFIFLCISAFFVALLLKVGGVFPASDFFLLFSFLIVFNISAITFCFFLSVWFNSARIGLLIGFLGWFVNYLPYIFVPGRYQTLSLGAKLGFCILSNTCMGLGINTISLLEIREEGVLWSNFYKEISLDDDFNLGYVFLMLIIDSIIYMLIAWYVNGVKPGQYGVPKPFYFPFLPSYWLGRPMTSNQGLTNVLEGVDAPHLTELDPSAHEQEPHGLSVGISVQYLTKIYDGGVLRNYWASDSKQKIAVNKLSLNMYEGQITALLGHNGAGKTTTISILTGLYTPTGGTAVINGYDIRSNMDQIRHSLGICPQHNVLFDRLTVLEHLKFFARIKGVRGKDVVKEAECMIEDLQLQDKKNTPSLKLSGGMKRKLSAGIALIGGSKFVVLDEPTSGIDPYARRAIWDLLIRYKEGRTILLTTHSMDEADLLGDRIAIMAEGKLRCSGSSLFLKSRYGVGYRMVIVKEPSCVSSKVTDIVTSLVQGGKNVTDVGAEVSYVLPLKSSQSFPHLFDTLEAQKEQLGIAGFGISVTTMEEVFIKVGEGTDETLDERIKRTGTTTDIPVSRSQSPSRSITHSIRPASPVQNETLAQEVHQDGVDTTEQVPEVVIKGKSSVNSEVPPKPPTNFVPNSGAVLWCQQFYAMFLKRFYNSLRFWQAIITQLVLPLLFVLIAMILAVTLPNANENDPPRPLRISNSALVPDSRLVFFATLGDVSSDTLDFCSVTADSIGATELLDYTRDTLDMYSYVQNVETPSRCCNYSYQILDKFCARQPLKQLNCQQTRFKNKFGYRRGQNCLECCKANKAVVPSCTNPLTQTRSPDQEDLCPQPPQVSVDDAESNATGRLESETVFVDETLLRKGNDMSPDVYIRRIQAGFVISYRDPPYAACGCNDADSFSQNYVNSLSECTRSDGAQVYALRQRTQFFDWLSRDCDEGGSGSGSGSGSGVAPFSMDYAVDGLSANLLQLMACAENSSCDGENSTVRPTAEFYPKELPQIAVTVYYNNNPWHMSAAALNAFHNVWLRQATNNSNLRLTINNHPLPRTVDAEVDATQQNFNGFAIGTMVVFGFSFLISTFVLFPINEKEIKAKHLQFVSGVDVTSFWISTYAWDLLNALVPVVLSVILFAAFQVEGYTGDGLAGVFLLLLLTCWCTIPMVYAVSFLFSNSLVAFAVIFFFLFITSQVFLLIQFFVTDQSTKDALHYLTLFDPSYALSIGLNDLYLNNIVRGTCTQNNVTRAACRMSDTIRYVDNPLSIDRPGVGVNLIYMTLEGVLFFALTLLLEVCFLTVHYNIRLRMFMWFLVVYRMGFSLLKSVGCLSNIFKGVKHAQKQQMNLCYFMARMKMLQQRGRRLC